MRHYLVPEAEVREKIDRIREETYGMERVEPTVDVHVRESDTSHASKPDT